MQKISRRRLAKHAATQLIAGESSGKLAKQLGAVLVATKRADQAEQLVDDISYELEISGEWAGATITSAREIGPELKHELTNFIKQATKVENVSLNQQIDKTVLGGIRIDTATQSWDQTIKRRLTNIREAF